VDQISIGLRYFNFNFAISTPERRALYAFVSPGTGVRSNSFVRAYPWYAIHSDLGRRDFRDSFLFCISIGCQLEAADIKFLFTEWRMIPPPFLF